MSDTNFPKNIEHMFESFHQSAKGEFKPTFYNPFEIKHRRRTTKNQYKVLEKAFEDNPKPNNAIRRNLAIELGMSPRGVQVWFQNRRAKKKQQETKTDKSGSEMELEASSPSTSCSTTSNTKKPNSDKDNLAFSVQRRFSVQPNVNSQKKAIDRRFSFENKPRVELSQVLDDIYLPDHIYNPEQNVDMQASPNIHLTMSPPVNPSTFGLQQTKTQLPMQRRIPIPQQSSFLSKFPQILPQTKAPLQTKLTPVKRSRSNSCPNVHDSLPFDELHSLLFNSNASSVNDEAKENQNLKTIQAKRQPLKRAISPTNRQSKYVLAIGFFDVPKRPRAVSVPSITWNGAVNPGESDVAGDQFSGWSNSYIEESSDSSNNKNILPQMVLPLKYDDELEVDNSKRKPRKNSGCSMNFLNSFVNMGFIPENQNRPESNSNDPYYQAIMRGGKLGLQDMYLYNDEANSGLETIAEIDQNNIFMNQNFIDNGINEGTWNPYNYNFNAGFSDQSQMNYYGQPGNSNTMEDVGFEYFTYIGAPSSDALFGDQL